MDLQTIQAYADQYQVILFDHAVMTNDGITELFTGKGNPLNNSYSVTKCFASAAIGLLWDEGKIGLDEPVTNVLKGEFDGTGDPGWEKVLVRHALGHTMGIARGYLDIDVEDIYSYGTEDFLQYALSAHLPYEPGTHYCYSDAAYYIVSRLVERRAGEKLDEFLMRRLLLPLRVQEAAFSRCPRNHPIGATGLYIRARDMVKLGFLYSQRGAWGGTQLISEKWIHEEEANQFSFERSAVEGVFCKGGMRGQMLLYSPSRGYAAAWHSYTVDNRCSGLLQCTCDLLEK